MDPVEDRSKELRAVAIVMWCLAFSALILRIFVRIGIMKAFTADDWAMILAMLSFTSNTITCVAGTFYGSGRHIIDLIPERAIKALMFWWSCYPTFALTMVLSKLSVGLFLLRIATQRIHSWIIYIALIATFTSSVIFFFVAIFQCSPISFAWNKTLSGTCLSLNTIINVTYGYSAFAIITDITFTLLPVWLVVNLQMDGKTKLAVIPIFCMACIASSAVAVRLAYLDGFRSPDFLWATTDIAIWSAVEQGLAIAAGSFAVIRPLLRIILSKIGFSNNDSTGTRPNRRTNTGYNYSNSGYSKQGGPKVQESSDPFYLSMIQPIEDEALERYSNKSTVELNSSFAH